jgi:hypothetical protein
MSCATRHPARIPLTKPRLAILILALSMIGGGCAGPAVTATSPVPSPSNAAAQTSSPTSSPTPIPAPSTFAAHEIVCSPNAGDRCAGALTPGRHTSVLFRPQITFDIPPGWADHADSDGEYVLYPPGSKQPATEGGTRDWIAFEASVMMPAVSCALGDPVDTGESAAAMAARMAGRVNLTTTTPRPITVGGLKGLVLDVRLSANAKPECSSQPGVNLIHGLGVSYGYDQGIGPGTAMRFYLFDRGKDVLAIEIDDVSGGGRLDEFAAILKTLQFAR